MRHAPSSQPEPFAVFQARIFTALMALVVVARLAWLLPRYTLFTEIAATTAFFSILLVATYFSIRCHFSMVHSTTPLQVAFDIALIVVYGAMAYAVHDTPLFMLLGVALFLLAAAKYQTAIGHVALPYLPSLVRKIRANCYGAVFCFVCLYLFTRGFVVPSLALFVFGFFAAQLYYFFVKPLYRIPAV